MGPGYKTRDGDHVSVTVAVGDKVLLPEYGGIPVKLDNPPAEPKSVLRWPIKEFLVSKAWLIYNIHRQISKRKNATKENESIPDHIINIFHWCRNAAFFS